MCHSLTGDIDNGFVSYADQGSQKTCLTNDQVLSKSNIESLTEYNKLITSYFNPDNYFKDYTLEPMV